MGNYNDFDLDIKKLQAENDNTNAGLTNNYVHNGALNVDTCSFTCGWLTTSCSGHCK